MEKPPPDFNEKGGNIPVQYSMKDVSAQDWRLSFIKT